ncbi:hypothetical protein CIB48_g9042 [Xylaria polymorpha]|nr:hypothetical protein CIB48_g9042 [Xylaria polymorpha]
MIGLGMALRESAYTEITTAMITSRLSWFSDGVQPTQYTAYSVTESHKCYSFQNAKTTTLVTGPSAEVTGEGF